MATEEDAMTFFDAAVIISILITSAERLLTYDLSQWGPWIAFGAIGAASSLLIVACDRK